jgi:hypothetical protein
MRLGPTRALLVGVALAALVAASGRYSDQYLDGQAEKQAAKEKELAAEFGACLKRYFADHPDRVGPKGGPVSFEEGMGFTDYTAAPIPSCQQYGHPASETSAEEYLKDSALAEYWSPKAAIALMLLFAAPWLWQFLLRRVAEVGAAFRGKSGGD